MSTCTKPVIVKIKHLEARQSGDTALRQQLSNNGLYMAEALLGNVSGLSLDTQAPSILVSGRFMLALLLLAICTMRLSFMKYTIPGADPRAPRPVP